jgi:hypothetical protein
MLAHYPGHRPNYHNAALSPYESIINEIGEDEDSDPWHFGRSLVEKILQTDGQEMATHTYSHYYCLEQGQTVAAFQADLESAIAIMSSTAATPKSIVFPRNQMTAAHITACSTVGINVFRGNPASYAYRSRAGEDNGPFVRAVRFLDSSMPLTGRHSYPPPSRQGSAINVKASRFFRPFSPRLGRLNELHVARIISEMSHAARKGEVYHLWCHPHNFGRHTSVQLERLEVILRTYQRLSEELGMRSVTMLECATASPTVSAPH